MTECPKCKSQRTATGHLATSGHSNRPPISFVPGESKWYQLNIDGGSELESQAFACPDCGMVWTDAAYPENLRETLSRFKKPD